MKAAAVCASVLLGSFAGPLVLYAQVADTSAPHAVVQDGGAVAPEAGSGVRIVRLSQTRGQVQLDRDIDRGFEAAFANMPITEHARIKTAEGVAEIEFEDNSSLRLTPNTIVDFPQLRRTSAGATLSTVHVVQGLVYVSLSNAKGNAFTIAYGQRQLALDPSAHVQLSVGASDSRLAVLDGAVQLQDASGTTVSTVSKKHSLFLDPAGSAPPTSMAKMEKTAYDDWDKTSTDYHKQYAGASAFGATAASYGTSDLNYYGSFVNLAGCGSVWRPYFASAGWNPFGNGIMAYYGAAGYSFVSPYPWGWTPYHSGEWQMCNAGGWGWHPGGSWAGLANATKAHQPVRAPGQPLPVSPSRPSLVAIGAEPVSMAQTGNVKTFVFRQDSAGLGVPRQMFGKLGDIATAVQHQGYFVTPGFASAGIVPTRAEREVAFASVHESAGSSAVSSPQASASRSFSSGVSAGSHGVGSAASSSGASPGGGGHH